MRTEAYHENILINASTLLLKDLNGDFSVLKQLHVIHHFLFTLNQSRGTCSEREKCDFCKRSLISRWDPQPVCVFSCNHVFHERCSKRHNFKCTICHNEYEEIRKLAFTHLMIQNLLLTKEVSEELQVASRKVLGQELQGMIRHPILSLLCLLLWELRNLTRQKRNRRDHSQKSSNCR